MLAEELPGRGSGRPQRDEHHREAQDEGERVDQGEPADAGPLVRGRQLIEREPRDEGDVGRDQRENARRDEGNHASQERRDERNLIELCVEHGEGPGRAGGSSRP